MYEEVNYEIEQILNYLRELDGMGFKSFSDFKAERVKNLASSMCVFSILNACIELGEFLVDLEDLETPLKYKEIFEILVENNVLSKEVGLKLANYMYLRNMLAHQYGRVDLKKIYGVVENRILFEKFVFEVKDILKSRKG
jgi:uncharacterized protein YutE (UPF0331/DUF86 family)